MWSRVLRAAFGIQTAWTSEKRPSHAGFSASLPAFVIATRRRDAIARATNRRRRRPTLHCKPPPWSELVQLLSLGSLLVCGTCSATWRSLGSENAAEWGRTGRKFSRGIFGVTYGEGQRGHGCDTSAISAFGRGSSFHRLSTSHGQTLTWGSCIVFASPGWSSLGDVKEFSTTAFLSRGTYPIGPTPSQTPLYFADLLVSGGSQQVSKVNGFRSIS